MQVAAKMVHYGYKMLQFDFYPKNQISFQPAGVEVSDKHYFVSYVWTSERFFPEEGR